MQQRAVVINPNAAGAAHRDGAVGAGPAEPSSDPAGPVRASIDQAEIVLASTGPAAIVRT
jgi:hypothetical protein